MTRCGTGRADLPRGRRCLDLRDLRARRLGELDGLVVDVATDALTLDFKERGLGRVRIHLAREDARDLGALLLELAGD